MFLSPAADAGRDREHDAGITVTLHSPASKPVPALSGAQNAELGSASLF